MVVISNMHNTENVSTVERKDKYGNKQTFTCPTPIRVDMCDQLMLVYFVSWKSRWWWVKIVYYLLDASIVSYYVLYKETVKISSTK
ncbi:hypothetical protein PR048_025594 [Dryococelus australis]|uniref:Uncharacterized protein n=1 Tax=Dryococelus australis TaxID=614101 RepID=A0ABQ9GRT1_9NEOP|nr:hypothetical protein PR048_025594 [Dryococelus australis]